MAYTSPAWWITCYAFLTATWEKKMDGTSERRTSKQDKKNNNNGTISSVNISKAIAEWKMTGNVNSSILQDVRSPSVTPSDLSHPTVGKLLHNLQFWHRTRPTKRIPQQFWSRGEKSQAGCCVWGLKKQPRCEKLTILWDLRLFRMCLFHNQLHKHGLKYPHWSATNHYR